MKQEVENVDQVEQGDVFCSACNAIYQQYNRKFIRTDTYYTLADTENDPNLTCRDTMVPRTHYLPSGIACLRCQGSAVLLDSLNAERSAELRRTLVSMTIAWSGGKMIFRSGRT